MAINEESERAAGAGVLTTLPPQFDRRVLQRLAAFNAQLDGLIVLDGAELKYHLPSLTSFFNDARYFPAGFGTRAIGRIKAGAPNLLSSATGLPTVPIAQLGQHVPGVVPLTAEHIFKSGVPANPQLHDLNAFATRSGVTQSVLGWSGTQLRSYLEGLTAPALTPELLGQLPMVEDSIGASVTLVDWWSCIVRHVGWFIAVAVFAAIGAAIITAFFTAGATLALWIWLAGVLGGGYATIALNCLVSPWR